MRERAGDAEERHVWSIKRHSITTQGVCVMNLMAVECMEETWLRNGFFLLWIQATAFLKNHLHDAIDAQKQTLEDEWQT